MMSSSRVVILTGATAGLGRAMASGLLAAGHRVAAVGRNVPAMDEVVAAARAAGSAERLLPVLASVRLASECERVVAETLARFGRIDALINNAGVNWQTVGGASAEFIAPPRFYDVTVDDWQATFETNVNGAFYLAHAVVPLLMRAGWGRIVNHTTSYLTMVRGAAAAYGPSKAALEAATSVWSNDLAGSGVTVNAITPGGASDTRMMSPAAIPDRGSLQSPDTLVPPILWLLTAAADGVSGKRIVASRWEPEASDDENLRRATAGAAWPESIATSRGSGRLAT
jgi:NAD(P)-dependent dehydrogenase (short-subunit alcohol dehydrogenase family)